METLTTALRQKSEHGSDSMTECEYEQSKADRYNRGIGNLNATDGYNCDLCLNRGYIAAVYHNEQYGYYSQQLVPCKCLHIRQAVKRLNRSGLKNVVRDYTFDRYTAEESWQKAIKSAAERFCRDESRNWFFIGGQSGAGKSHICTAIAVYYIRKGLDTKYMLWRDEITRIKTSITEPEQYAAMMEELKETDVLYIDDLFKTGKDPNGKMMLPTAADVNAAFEIINYRYNDPKLITIISSERTLTDLTAIDEAIAGRIAERSKDGGYCINLKHDPARNYRLKGVVDL